MRKISIVAACVAGVLFAPAVAAKPIPIHFIYVKSAATYEQFQSDRDVCASRAKHPKYYPGWEGHYFVRDWPSSTVFLNCMTERGYTLAKEGWDTGVMWTLPYLRRGR